MITLAQIKDSFFDKKKRILKIIQYGVKTAQEVSAFGDDANPLKGMTAVYADTGEMGEPVIIGYINENQLAAIGEKRIYSLKSDGSLSNYIWLKNDETIEIGGNVDNLIRYAALDLSLQNQTNLINVELGKIAAVLNSLAPGSYVVTPVAIDNSAARIDKIKTS